MLVMRVPNQKQRDRDAIWFRLLVVFGPGLAAMCALPLVSLLTHAGAASHGVVWGRFAERRAILIAFIPYGLALIALRRTTVSRRVITGFGVGYMMLLLALPALGSRDLFSYIFYGHMLAHAHLNPLTTAPNHLVGDRWLSFVSWRHTPSVYGPYGPI